MLLLRQHLDRQQQQQQVQEIKDPKSAIPTTTPTPLQNSPLLNITDAAPTTTPGVSKQETEPRQMPPRPPTTPSRGLPTPTPNDYRQTYQQHPEQQKFRQDHPRQSPQKPLPQPTIQIQSPQQHTDRTHSQQHHQHNHRHNSSQSSRGPDPRALPRRQLPAPQQLVSSHQLQADSAPVHTCAVCRKAIDNDERVVQTNGVHLHVSCFRCWHCRMQLEHSQFYFVANPQRLYCHLDYHELFSQRCAYCETPIEGNAIYALDKHWHPGHFFCAQCNKPFKEEEDYCILGKTAWCEPCYSKKTALSCWKCNHKLLNGEACIEALGRNWCNTCFCCEVCTEPFQSNEFILREDGTLVCLPCEARRIRTDVWK